MKKRIVISKKPIKPEMVLRSVANTRSGGAVFFIGTVRSESRGTRVSRMCVEAAEDLAKADLARICDQVKHRFDVNDIAVMHRVGNLKKGDIIVAIGVGAAHREDAFAACRFMIDELKKTTPIWKKEIGPSRERWV